MKRPGCFWSYNVPPWGKMLQMLLFHMIPHLLRSDIGIKSRHRLKENYLKKKEANFLKVSAQHADPIDRYVKRVQMKKGTKNDRASRHPTISRHIHEKIKLNHFYTLAQFSQR